jgi:hypothetical protein
MGATRRYAERMNLIDMAPRGELSSTGFVLANPGAEYPILQPSETGVPFTVNLEPGAYSVEWHNVVSRETQVARPLTVQQAGRSNFSAPFAEPGPAVLYLRRT